MCDTVLKDECMIDGAGDLQQYEYATGKEVKWVGIVLASSMCRGEWGSAAIHWKT